jgi:hypothetical protein
MGLGYVFAVGDASKITTWTLQQTNEDKVRDGITAIKHIVADSISYRASERRSAASGFLQVYQRAMLGWPNIQPAKTPFASSDAEGAKQDLVRFVRGWANELHEHWPNDSIASDLWSAILKLDPDVVKSAPKHEPNGLFSPNRKP